MLQFIGKNALVIILWSILVLVSSTLYAQSKGVLNGVLRDKEKGETVIGATISIPGTPIGTVSDIDGKYQLVLNPGIYRVEIHAVGYTPIEIPTMKIEASDTLTQNYLLETEATELQAVTIVAKADKESESVLLQERKEATEVVQKIGAQEMSRKGVSNAAEGVAKMVGVATPDAKLVVVRGLGDRYNYAMLNGLPVPSTNPDQKVIPLDIFPAGAIKNLSVSKSYAPQYYGDVAGGMIDIVTKDYAPQHFVQIGVSTSVNTITTGKQFLRSASNASGYTSQAALGYAATHRSLPGEVSAVKYYDSREMGAVKSPFQTRFSPLMQIASPIYGLHIATGNFIMRNAHGKGWGYYLSVSHKNDLKFSPGTLALYNAQQSPRYQYKTENYNYNANTTSLANVVYKWNHKHQIGWTSLYVNDAHDNWIVLQGTDNDLGTLYSRRNTYQQNTLWVNQFYGKHELGLHNKITWGLSWNRTDGNMPDRIQNTFRVHETTQGQLYTFASDAVSNNHRFFARLKDDEYNGNMVFTHRNTTRQTGFVGITAGINARYKSRVFWSRQIDMKIAGGDPVHPDDIDNAFYGRTLGDGVSTGSYKYVESYYAPNNYEAELKLAAAFANLEFTWQNWHILAGLRAEYASQLVFYKKGSDTYDASYRQADLTGWDWMPAISVKKQITPKANLLIAASRTITRPQFVEMGPFRYNESFGTQEREGNPLLKNSTNYNVDVKYEWYPSTSEIVSVNLLGKYMLDPIELVIVASADPLLTFVNTNRAYVGGLELEYSRNLGKWLKKNAALWDNSSLGFNLALLYSAIQIDDLKKLQSLSPIALTNTSRPLMGASPYILNVDYSYKHYWSKDKSSYTMLTILYNVFGKRIFAAGSQGAGDIYEMPYHTLDLTFNTQILKNLSVNLAVGNILNPDIIQQQQFNSGNLDVLRYKKGLDFSLSMSYKF